MARDIPKEQGIQKAANVTATPSLERIQYAGLWDLFQLDLTLLSMSERCKVYWLRVKTKLLSCAHIPVRSISSGNSACRGVRMQKKDALSSAHSQYNQ